MPADHRENNAFVSRPRSIQLYVLLGPAVLIVPAIGLPPASFSDVRNGDKSARGLALVLQLAVLLPLGDYGPIWIMALNVFSLVCLVLPSTRAFVFASSGHEDASTATI